MPRSLNARLSRAHVAATAKQPQITAPPQTGNPQPTSSAKSAEILPFPTDTQLADHEKLCQPEDEKNRRQLWLERTAARQRSLEKAAGQAGIPEEYRNASFMLDPEGTPPQIQRARVLIEGWASRFPEARRGGHCLVIHGGIGTGKTHLACAVQIRVISERFTAIYTKESRIHRRFLDAGKTDDEPALSIIDSYVTPDLLVIDEVGCQIGTPTSRWERLRDIFDDRYSGKKPTVLVSNLTLPEIEEHLGGMIWSRISKKGFQAVPMYGPDYRRDHYT